MAAGHKDMNCGGSSRIVVASRHKQDNELLAQEEDQRPPEEVSTRKSQTGVLHSKKPSRHGREAKPNGTTVKN